MSYDQHKNASGVFATVLIGLIIIAFLFGGYQGFKSSGDSYASVDGTPISLREFEMEYGRTVQFYQNMINQGKPLSSKQIEQFRVKDQALERVVQRKLLLNRAENIGLGSSETEITSTIKSMPYFKTNDEFDFNKYKLILNSNSYTPTEFEESVATDIKVNKIRQLFNMANISKAYAKDLKTLEQKKLLFDGVKIVKDQMIKHVEVSKKEIQQYLANQQNEGKIATLFQSRKQQLDQPLQVKARHILLRNSDKTTEKERVEKLTDLKKQLTAKNFAKLANKYTEDPSGKSNGGDLGWFGPGRMVPEFDKVVFGLKKGQISSIIKTDFGHHIVYLEDRKEAKEAQLADYKNDLAKELVQREKRQEVANLIKDVSTKAADYLEKNKIKDLKKLAKTYDLPLVEKQEVSILDKSVPVLELPNTQFISFFTDQAATKKAQKIDSPTTLTVFTTQEAKTEKPASKINEILEQQSRSLGSKWQNQALQQMRQNAKVVQYR